MSASETVTGFSVYSLMIAERDGVAAKIPEESLVKQERGAQGLAHTFAARSAKGIP